MSCSVCTLISPNSLSNTDQTTKNKVIVFLFNIHSCLSAIPASSNRSHSDEMIKDVLFIATADGTLFPPTQNLFYSFTDIRF